MNREDFPILKETVYGKPLVYLDNAATSQKPQQVIDAIAYAYSHFNANIHRGVHKLSQTATMEHEKAREKVANFLGARDSKEIIFTKGTTDSLNMLAFSLGEAMTSGGRGTGDAAEGMKFSGAEAKAVGEGACGGLGEGGAEGRGEADTEGRGEAGVRCGVGRDGEESPCGERRAFPMGWRGIGEGDEIVVSGMEHHANIVPWQMLCERKGARLRVIPLRDDLTLDMEALEGLLNERTRLVSVAHVSNVLGVINPVEEVVRMAHERGVPVCVDAAQSVPHMPVNVQDLDCDFLVLSGHKMYGPTGVGVLYGKEEWLEGLPPAEGGGEMIDHVRWGKTTYNVLPYKWEAGTPNFVGTYALGKAVEYMESIGMEKLAEHERNLTHMAIAALRGINLHGCTLVIYAEEAEKAGVVSLNVYNASGKLIHPYDVGVLLDRQGVAVRTGHHCAEPLIDSLGVPGTVRASFGLYTDEQDIAAFAKALEKAVLMLS